MELEKYEKQIYAMIFAGIFLVVGVLILAEIKDDLATCTPGSTSEGWLSQLLNDTSDNEDTAIVMNPSLPSWFTVLWYDTAGPGGVGEAMWNGTTEEWEEQYIGCATGGNGLSADSQQAGAIYATYQDTFTALTLAYGGWGDPWACCEEDNTTSPVLGNWTSVIVNETTGGPDYAVAYTDDAGTDLYFMSVAVPCVGAGMPGAVDADAGGPQDLGLFVSLIWNDDEAVYDMFYLNGSAGDLKHAWGAAGGPWNTEVVKSGVQAPLPATQYPNIDAHDLTTVGGDMIACYYNGINDTLEITWGAAGGPWSVEELADGGKYCSIDIKDETIPWYQIMYQGPTGDMMYVEGIPGMGIHPDSPQTVDSITDARYTDTLVDPVDNTSVGSVEDNDDNSTWFVYVGDVTTPEVCDEEGDVLNKVIEALGDFGAWWAIIALVLSAGVLIYMVTSKFRV